MGTERQFESIEVSRHHTRGDSWVTVDGVVYDVSSFAEHHPGGETLLLSHCGGDVSASMRSEASHTHSKAAFSILDGMRIGVLKNDVKTTPAPSSSGHSSAGHAAYSRNGCVSTATGLHRRSGAATATESSSLQDEFLKASDFSLDGWREEDLVDWTKPMLWQVGKLGTLYHKWVHSPVNKPLRLFQSDFVEFFSKTPWYVVPIVWLPVMVLLSFLSTMPQLFTFAEAPERLPSASRGLSSSAFSMLFMTGTFAWTFVEYCLHRCVFHHSPPDDSPFLITVHFLLHGQHHKVPFESMRLVFPPVPAFIIFSMFYISFVLVFPMDVAHAILAGGLLGYIGYDLTHYYLHHGVPPFGTYFHRLKSYHVRHHFVDHQAGFGISSKLWDFPFGTTTRS